jgi:hypothetical protein
VPIKGGGARALHTRFAAATTPPTNPCPIERGIASDGKCHHPTSPPPDSTTTGLPRWTPMPWPPPPPSSLLMVSYSCLSLSIFLSLKSSKFPHVHTLSKGITRASTPSRSPEAYTKYFRHGAILSAKKKDGMSYTWRSILKGLELLKKGIIWRIGNGEDVRIWEDPWVPRGSTRRPLTSRRTWSSADKSR